ncbi:MAG: cytochrome c [Bacteroidota bacterium]
MLSNIKWLIVVVLIVALMSGCNYDNAKRNVEYAPNMYNSLPLEPYSETEYHETDIGGNFFANGKKTDQEILSEIGFKYGMSAQKPPEGTVPRVETQYYESEHEIPWQPYSYKNTPQEYERAGLELDFPGNYQFTSASFEKGEELYTTFCVNCHGANGAGNGILVQKEKYAGVPAYEQRLAQITVGKMFHTLTYGKGVMGSHAGQMTQRERWEVINYILQWRPEGADPGDGYAAADVKK